jgi:2-keto-4-pentenoate hydratase/2-oxohepta-3-ene-1,7-dioic acid hydratase in catechol pathway
MRLCTFRPSAEAGGRWRLGIVQGDRVYDAEGEQTIEAFLRRGKTADTLRISGEGVRLGDAAMTAPVRRPGKIVAAIVNTRAMLGGRDASIEWPRLDMKAPSTVIGPGETIRAPASGIRPEVELAVILGKTTAKASRPEAKLNILGYTVLNDVTAPQDSRDDAYEAYRRDRKTGEIRKALMRGPLFRSKNHDGFCPMGPWIVSPDEVGDAGSLKMSTKFEGRPVQSGSSSEYIFAPEEIVSYVSGFLSLEPGDLVSCGSVGWVPEALGDRDPTEYVLPRSSGLLELEIEKVGALSNPVAPERESGTPPVTLK